MKKYTTKYRIVTLLTSLLLISTSFILFRKEKPVLYIIGDSTVRNGDGSGRNLQWGWGSFIAEYFDTSKLGVRNHALGGRSSRTFITEGRWDRVLAMMNKGDYVIMQFGHNDAGPLDDTARARGTIKGIGEDVKEIYNPITKKQELVHTYGWYMRRYIRETKDKGAIPIVCSPVPRENWKDGKITRTNDSYTLWASQVAKEEGAFFIDLNDVIAIKYEEMGDEKVKSLFQGDHTHTNIDGAKLNAQVVMDQLNDIKPGKLKKYLRAK